MNRHRLMYSCISVLLLMLTLVVGCSDGVGTDPVAPGSEEIRFSENKALEVLGMFSQACLDGDLELITGMMTDSSGEIQMFTTYPEILPLLGEALADAVVSGQGENWFEFSYTLSHPEDPSHAEIPATIYVISKRGAEDDRSDLLISLDESFVYRNVPERSTQWESETHQDVLTHFIIDFYLENYPEDTEFIEWLSNDEYGYSAQLMQGSYDEDKGLPGLRGMVHFMTPRFQTSLPDGPQAFSPLNDEPWNAPVNALDWGFGLDSFMDVPNEFTWQTAVQKFESGETGDAFNCLGHLLHLLEDMTCSPHVRNDAHPPWDSDPFESWAQDYSPYGGLETYDFKEVTEGIYDDLSLNRIDRDPMNGFTDSELLQDFYDMANDTTGEEYEDYRDYPGVAGLFMYTSWVTNHLYFSQDSIYESTYSGGTIDTSDYPVITDFNIVSGLRYFNGTTDQNCLDSLVELGIIPGATSDYVVGRAGSLYGIWEFIFRIRHWWQAPTIDDVIEAINDGWPLVTLNDREDYDYYTGDITGVCESEYEVVFPLAVVTGAALLHECYLEVFGVDPVACAVADINIQEVGNPVNFSAACSYDPDGGEIELYEWDRDDGNGWQPGTVDEVMSWENPGTYYVNLRVTDDEGDTDELDECIEITIEDSGASGDPVNPQLITTFPGYYKGVYAFGGYVYAVEVSQGLKILNIDNPDSPYIEKDVAIPGNNFHVHADDGYAYVTVHHPGGGFYVVDVDPVATAHIEGSIPSIGGYAYCSEINGDYAVLLTDKSGQEWYKGIDIFNPANPYVCHTLYDSSNKTAMGMCLYENIGYIGMQTGRIRIMDLTDTCNPRQLIDIPNSEYNPRDLDYSNGYAYMVSESGWLRVIDVDPVLSANIVNSVHLPGRGFGIEVQGDYAYVAAHTSGLQVLDVSDPVSAYIYSSCPAPGQNVRIAVDGQYAYMASETSGLHVIKLW